MEVEENHVHNDLGLMEALNFDVHDLATNRDGNLTENQRNSLVEKRKLWRQLYVLVSILTPFLLVAIVADGYRVHDTVSSRIGICSFTLFVSFGLIGYFYSMSKLFANDLLENHVSVAEGKAHLTKYRARNGMRYFVKIGATKFKINGRIFRGLVNESPYRAYYVVHSKTLLAAEKIDDES